MPEGADDVLKMTARGMQWLSRAADDPQACRERWYADPRAPQILVTGRLFDLVAMPMALGLHVLAGLQEDTRCSVGAVVVNERRRRVGFLVGPGSAVLWPIYVTRAGCDVRLMPCFGKGNYLLSPGPMPTADISLWWQRGPDGSSDDLTSLTTLAVAVADARTCRALPDADSMTSVGPASTCAEER